MSRDGDSRMSYTSDQVAVHEYIARKRGTPVPHDARNERYEEPRQPHRKEEKKTKKKVQIDEPETNGAAADDIISFEKVISYHP